MSKHKVFSCTNYLGLVKCFVSFKLSQVQPEPVSPYLHLRDIFTAPQAVLGTDNTYCIDTLSRATEGGTEPTGTAEQMIHESFKSCNT